MCQAEGAQLANGSRVGPTILRPADTLRAAECTDVGETDNLMGSRAELDIRDASTRTPLSQAIRAKTAYIASLVLAAGVALIGASLPLSGMPETLLLALGSTLVTSSVFSVVVEAMLRLDLLREFQDEVSELRSDLHRLLQKSSKGIGGVNFLESRRLVDFGEFLRQSKGIIRIAGLSANDILSAPNVDLLFQAVAQGRVNSVRVRLLDQASAAGTARASHPAYRGARSAQAKAAAVIAELEDLSERLRRNGLADALEWRLIADPITVSLVADDTTMIVTPVIRTKTGGISPTFMFARDQGAASFYETYLDHFDSLGE